MCLAMVSLAQRPAIGPAAIASETSAGSVSPTPSEIRRLLDEGRPREAEARARELLRDAVSSSGADSLGEAEALDLLVEALWRGGESHAVETRQLAERAVRLKDLRLGPDAIDLAVSLNNLGIVCSDAGDHAAAEAAYRRALAIQVKALGTTEDASIARTLQNLGNVYFHRGEYSAAREHYERALAIREKVLGGDHAEVATSLLVLAALFREMGDYVAARPLYERAVAIRQARLGPEHPHLAFAMADLAGIVAALGDEERAGQLLERALAILETAWGAEHPAVARILTSLGALSLAKGEVGRARPLIERALAIRERTHGAHHAHIAESLGQLAEALAASGETGPARALAERAVETWERAVGPSHPATAGALHSLARLLWREGDAGKAEALLLRAVRIREEALGAWHPDVAETLATLAAIHLAEGRAGQALDPALRAEEVGRRHLRLLIRAIPERQALRLAAHRERGLDAALEAVAREPGSARAREAWDALIRSRALVLDEVANRNRTYYQASESGTLALLERLGTARARLAHLVLRGPGGADPARYRRLVDEARAESEQVERLLAERSAAFRERAAGEAIGLDAVVSALPPAAALLALAVYERPRAGKAAGGAPDAQLLAFVLPSREARPIAVALGSAARVDSLVGAWREEMSRFKSRPVRGGLEAEARYQQATRALREAVWDPVAPHLAGARLVFVVPDGTLNLLNLAALPTADGRYLLEAGPTFHSLAAERDLVYTGAPDLLEGRLVAVGGPDFDLRLREEPVARASEAAPAADRSGRGGTGAAPPSRERGAPCGGEEPLPLRFAALPGASREASWVASQWESAAGSGAGRRTAIRLLGARASEQRLKRVSPGSAVLHLATHGFFLSGPCGGWPGPPGGRAGADRSREGLHQEVANPLLLSGLALAGANSRGVVAAGGNGDEDGLLTAAEIATLDLSSVQWVVLSACGTGLGEPRAGEGVLGLRRAFRVAGAKTLILSLWDVDDSAALEWIAGLYRHRLAGSTTAEAVREASLHTLRARREAGLGAHPFFWGAFVAAGDWR